MRKLAGNLNRANTLCVFTNQIREKVGVMFGSPETQPGGRALKFYSSQRLDIRRIETLKEGTEAVGNRVRVKVVKNKVAAPFRQAEFDIEYGQGISSEGCMLDLGIEHGIVQKSGSFFSYGDERLGQGRNNVKGYLREHPEIAKEIEGKIYEELGHRAGRRPAGGVPPPSERPTPRPRPPEAPDAGGAGRLGACDRTDDRERALELAYRAVRRRERTVAELRTGSSARRVEPETIDDGGGRAARDRLPGRRPLRPPFAEDKRELDQLGRGADRDGAAPARDRAGADRGRARRRTTARPSCGPRCCCSAGATHAPPDDRERDRAWRMLVRRGY